MPRFTPVLASLAVFFLGCGAQREVRWNEEAGTIGPERTGCGYLSVEIIDPLVVLSHVPRMRSAPFLLYDEGGRYLARYENPYVPPLALRPGRYVVVARVEGKERQIQVRLAEGRLTRVNLSDLGSDLKVPDAPLGWVPENGP